MGPRDTDPHPTPPFPAHSPNLAGGSRSGLLSSPSSGNQLRALQKQSIQTSILYVVYREAGWGGAAAPRRESRSLHLPARPAPRRRTCDRCAGAPHRPEARGAPADPRPPEAPGSALPVRTVPPGAPSPSVGRGAPPARALRGRAR